MSSNTDPLRTIFSRTCPEAKAPVGSTVRNPVGSLPADRLGSQDATAATAIQIVDAAIGIHANQGFRPSAARCGGVDLNRERPLVGDNQNQLAIPTRSWLPGNGLVTPPCDNLRVRRVAFWLLALVGSYLVAIEIVAGRPWSDVLLTCLTLAIYWSVSGLIIFRREGHATGWLLAGLGLLLVFGDASPYLTWFGEPWLTWFGSWVWTAVFAVFAALTLTFPSGHPPRGTGFWSRAGRAGLWALPCLLMTAMLADTLGGSPSTAGRANPMGFLPGWSTYASLFGVVSILVAGSVALVVRRRRTTTAERAQITWVVFGLVILALAILTTFAYIFAAVALGYGDPGDAAWTPAWLTMLTFPLWFGVAILRYRLFDIDRIVSRTVTYSVLGALLAGVFALVVTTIGSLFRSGSSDLGVASSTLLVAGLFNPLRKRVQLVVDRRFNRSHYDAMRIGDAFEELVRAETHVSRIVASWLDAVDQTLQPTTVSIWIRGLESTSPDGAPSK